MIDEKDKKKDNAEKAKKAPEFNTSIEESSIKISSKRINSFLIKYYKIDVEILFSKDPFQKVKSKNYSHVLPFLSENV